MLRWLRPRPRTTGRPTSANGASSFHLWWGPPVDRPLVAVEATLEVLDEPVVPSLYFWALQVSFQAGALRTGGAHLGLQWYPRHPRSRAVNFGGYRAGGGLLAGSPSPLPSATGNENTRDLGWEPRRRYRLAIRGIGEGSWRGTVTDVGTGVETLVRDLHPGGDLAVAPVVWSEVFARCDDPSVRVAWSDLRATTTGGDTIAPARVRVTYQGHAQGGCDNTNAWVGPDGRLVQQTNVGRTTPPESALVPPPTTGVA